MVGSKVEVTEADGLASRLILRRTFGSRPACLSVNRCQPPPHSNQPEDHMLVSAIRTMQVAKTIVETNSIITACGLFRWSARHTEWTVRANALRRCKERPQAMHLLEPSLILPYACDNRCRCSHNLQRRQRNACWGVRRRFAKGVTRGG